MKVLFSNPPWWKNSRGLFVKKWTAGVRAGSRWPFTLEVGSKPDQYRAMDYTPYPFFMGYAATYAQKHTKAQVAFRDSIALKESYQTFYKHLVQNPYDIIFLESATPSWEHDEKIIEQIGQLCPRTRIVLTGPITSVRPEELIGRHKTIVACIKGEYEKGAVKVIEGKTGVIEHDLLTAAEMNSQPFPYYDELHAHRYWDSNPIGQQFPHAHVWSSRGCPFKCIFCVWPATMTGNDPTGDGKRQVRYYAPEYMEDFLGQLIRRYHFRSIYFDDDTFNLGNTHTSRMCAVMKKLGVSWSAMCRADTIKFETWGLMKESGCFGVKLGFESGSQYVVDQIVNKHLDLNFAREVVHQLKKIGMTVHGTFTYGLPGETKDQMIETKLFAQNLPFDSMQQSGTAEIEGTPLATLRQSGSLRQYQGAQMDANYAYATDGNSKWQSIVKELQNG